MTSLKVFQIQKMVRDAIKKKSREINENGTFSLYTPPPPLNSEIQKSEL